MALGARIVVQGLALQSGAQTKIDKKISRIAAARKKRRKGFLPNDSEIREGAPYSRRMTGGLGFLNRIFIKSPPKIEVIIIVTYSTK